MATGNLLLGMGRGSIGDVTLYRSFGQQRARARNRKPKNPKTAGQTAQRIIMRTAVRAYSTLKELCDHSFEGKSYGAECMNYFNSVNADMLRAEAIMEQNAGEGYYGDFSNIASPGITLNPFIVSKGQLPSLSFKSFENNVTKVAFDLNAAPATLSYADVISALGLKAGDQITVIQVNQFYGFGRFQAVNWGRFILMPKSGDLSKLVTDESEFNDKNVGQLVFSLTNGSLEVNVNSSSDQFYAAAAIVSRKSNNAWLRSDAALQLATNVTGMPMSEALASDETETLGESPYYLNQASTAVAREGGEENP